VRIAIVCPYDWTAHGGVRAHVAQLALQLQGRHEVRIVAPASAPLPGDPVDSLVIPVGRPRAVPFNRSVARIAPSPQAYRWTARALRDAEPDVIHVHEPEVPAVSLAAALPAGKPGTPPIVGTYHAWSDRDRAYRAVAPFARRLARRLAVRIAVSKAAQRYHADALRLPLGAFRVVPNGVDAAQFAVAEPLPELRDPERPLLLFVGRLERRKGLETLIRAYLRLRAFRPEVRLCVIGDGPERARCEALIPASIRPDVMFVGAVDEADKARYFRSADVYVAPNLGGESFGIILLEAMAAGLPVVASDIPGFRTVLRDGVEGRLVPPGDGFGLADALGTLLDNPRLQEAMATEGLARAQEYAWPRVAERISEIYEEVAAGA
jgi:phosphatidyl-myo-inositol alpha-mannosyltransferase